MSADAQARRGQLMTAAGAVAWSTSGLFQRGMQADAPVQVAGRALVAGIAVTLLVCWTTRGKGGPLGAVRAMGRVGTGMAISYAIASGSFMFALSLTSVAHVLLFQAATPLVAALLARFFLGEPIHLRTWLAMAGAALGIAIMVAGSSGEGSLGGDLLAGVVAIAFAVTIVLARRANARTPVVAGGIGQLIVLTCVLPFALGSLGSLAPGDVPLIFGVGIIQMFLGITLFTAGARLIPAAQASLISLLEVVLGPLLVWIAYREQPSRATVLGGGIVLGTLVLHTIAEQIPARSERGPLPAPP